MKIELKPLTLITIISIILITIIVLHPLIELGKYDYRYLYATRAYGYSMLPTIHSGDLLIIALKDSPYYHPDIGDIMVYRYDNFFVAHRLVAMRGDTYFFKGDNNNYIEEVPEDAIIGEVVETIPKTNIIAEYLAQGLLPPP